MYGIIINSKECAAEDEPGYFISLSQQKEKGIHMNTFLQSVQNLDGEILRFGDQGDQGFNLCKRPWSCHYVFEKQVGNDCPEDQG